MKKISTTSLSVSLNINDGILESLNNRNSLYSNLLNYLSGGSPDDKSNDEGLSYFSKHNIIHTYANKSETKMNRIHFSDKVLKFVKDFLKDELNNIRNNTSTEGVINSQISIINKHLCRWPTPRELSFILQEDGSKKKINIHRYDIDLTNQTDLEKDKKRRIFVDRHGAFLYEITSLVDNLVYVWFSFNRPDNKTIQRTLSMYSIKNIKLEDKKNIIEIVNDRLQMINNENILENPISISDIVEINEDENVKKS